MTPAEIYANPNAGLAYATIELLRRTDLGVNEALNTALAQLRSSGSEPSWASICSARALARQELSRQRKVNLASGDRRVTITEAAAASAGKSVQLRPISLPIEPKPFVYQDPTTLPRRQWLYGRHLIRGEISLTLAPGGLGKTSLAVAEAASLVSGRKLLHDHPSRRFRVWLWNGEEPEEELARRVGAVGIHYGMTPDQFGDRLFIDTGHSLPLVLAEQSRDGVRVHSPVVDRLVEALVEREIDVMLVDPFVSTHSVNENDNSAIQRAASAWKEVAHRAGVAIGLAHHVRKLAGRDATAEDSRGGDALVSKARDARTLNPMGSDDAARLGIAPAERASYFSTGTGGKANMSPRTGGKCWFKLVSVGLGNGGSLSEPQDHVAVVTPWAPERAAASIDPEHVQRLASIMAGGVWRSAAQAWKREDWIGRAIAAAFDIEQDDGFVDRVKPLQKALLAARVLVPDTTTNAKREIVQIVRLGDLSAYDVQS